MSLMRDKRTNKRAKEDRNTQPMDVRMVSFAMEITWRAFSMNDLHSVGFEMAIQVQFQIKTARCRTFPMDPA